MSGDAPKQDLSVLEDTRRELEASEQRYRAVVEQANDGILISGPDGRFEDANIKACEILGYSREELLQLGPVEIVPQHDKEMLMQRLEQMRSLRFSQRERDLVRSDGSLLPVEISSRLLDDGRVVAIFRDVSQRRLAEAAAARYAERLEVLHWLDRAILQAESTRDIAEAALAQLDHVLKFQRASVLVATRAPGRLVMLALRVDGRTSVPVGIEIPLEELPSPERLAQGEIVFARDMRAERPVSSLRRALIDEGIVASLTVPLVAHDRLVGVLNIGHDSADPYSDDQVEIAGEVAGPLALAIEQGELKERLRRQQQELARRVEERTAELKEVNTQLEAFTYSVSHDLKAPVRAMRGFAEILQEDYAEVLDEVGHDFLARILDASGRMHDLINDLLEYSRLGRADVEMASLSLARIMDEVLEALRDEIAATGARIEVHGPLPMVRGSSAVLLRVLKNLVENAIKYTRAGQAAEIHVSLEPPPEPEDLDAPPRVHLVVADNGLGIDASHHARIFDVFERLHARDAYPGTGVGLAIVKRGIERLGGRVGLESKLGEGSRFWIELLTAE